MSNNNLYKKFDEFIENNAERISMELGLPKECSETINYVVEIDREPKISLEELLAYLMYLQQNHGDVCPICDGHGLLYDINDRDEVEGYKLARRKLTCYGCGGSGALKDHVNSDVFLFNLNSWVRTYRAKKEKENFLQAVKDQLANLKETSGDEFSELISFVEERLKE